jgi:hypothetical protein
MAKVTYGSKWGRVKKSAVRGATSDQRAPEDVVREMKKGEQKPPGEDYREKALAIFGLICARCGREFDGANRRLLTVHHIDGNHDNNPPDGSNWVNLCVYCHEDIHSRGLLGEYFAGLSSRREAHVVYDEGKGAGLGSLADKLGKALREKEKTRS